MSLEVGIVGLANVGKSTLFQALSSAKAEAANYPFCTIEPNVGLVELPDTRLDFLAETFKPQSVVPNAIKFVDIAGLVEGAAKGQGLGNKFLEHIRQVDVYIHLVRCFSDENITHVEGGGTPIEDILITQTELVLSDLERVNKRVSALKSSLKGANKDAQKQYDFLVKLQKHLNQGNMASNFEQLNSEQEPWVKELSLITIKPFFYLVNVKHDQLQTDKEMIKSVEEIATQNKVNVITVDCALESQINELNEPEKQLMYEEFEIPQRSLTQVIVTSFKLLNLISFFTAGEKEVRAWNVTKGSLAPQAAGKIHSDFQKGFIKADVYHYNDLIECKSEYEVKKKGKLRSEGKEYVVNDGDIIFFKFNL